MSTEKLQIDESTKIIEFMSRWSGISLESNKRTTAQNTIYKLRYFINVVWINILLIASIAWCINGIADGIDFTEVTRSLCGDVFVFLGDIKSVSFIIYENSINELMAALKTLENEENDRERPDEIKEMIKREIRFLTKALKIYMFGLGISGMSFVALPAVAVAVNYFRHHELTPLLPMLVLFPFDPLDIKFWPFVYVLQIWSVTMSSFQNGVTDCLFVICCTYLRIHFKILGHDIEHVIEKNDTKRKFYANEEFKKKFSLLVKRHQHILKTITILEKIYAPSNLFNFLGSAVVICLNGFNIAKLNDMFLGIVFVIFFFLTSLQIFSLCYFADMLINQGMQVSDAVYNSNWYLAEKSVVKDLQILLLRAQKPCKITAYGFADVNLLAFSKIMKTAWSYFSLLNTIYSEGKN